jgi:hypothetical protein
MNIEDQLREVLRRREPSAGFAERVAARAEPGRQREPVGMFGWRSATSALALAAVLVFTAGSLWQRTQEERAGHQAVLALRIASEKLNQTRSKALHHTEGQ